MSPIGCREIRKGWRIPGFPSTVRAGKFVELLGVLEMRGVAFAVSLGLSLAPRATP